MLNMDTGVAAAVAEAVVDTKDTLTPRLSLMDLKTFRQMLNWLTDRPILPNALEAIFWLVPILTELLLYLYFKVVVNLVFK